ncbi:MAG: hypothetical protein V3V33_12805 [Candidatus Lokiarchaeia archaeon]
MWFKILSLEGWINGISAIIYFIIGVTFGIFLVYKAKKHNVRLLFYFGLAFICMMIPLGGLCIDFLTIIFTGTNSYYYLDMTLKDLLFSSNIIVWMWIPPAVIFAMYIGAEILKLEKKKYLISIYIVLGVIYEFFIFLDPQGSFTMVFPPTPGEKLIEGYFRFGSPAFFIELIFTGSLFFFLGFTFLFKGIQSTGVIRKKFLFLAIGDFIIAIFSAQEAFSDPGILVVFYRIVVIFGFYLKYLGIKEEPAEPKKALPKKEVKVEESLFRLSKRPDLITEEEVTLHKEKKICLVCKGKVSKFNVFICDCDALYCENCARALSTLENMCWACNAPIDESKPVKPYKEEKPDVKISKKNQE